MASRRTMKSGKGRKGKTKAQLRKLLGKARVEVQELLKGDQAGTLTRVNMKARLVEIKEILHDMEPLESWNRR